MTGPATVSTTLVEAICGSMAASLRMSDGVAAPVALLWADANGQWKPLLPALQKALPQLYRLGPYEPAERQGPVIWLKCIVDRSLSDAGAGSKRCPDPLFTKCQSPGPACGRRLRSHAAAAGRIAIPWGGLAPAQWP